jgi:hypothetical protein
MDKGPGTVFPAPFRCAGLPGSVAALHDAAAIRQAQGTKGSLADYSLGRPRQGRLPHQMVELV